MSYRIKEGGKVQNVVTYEEAESKLREMLKDKKVELKPKMSGQKLAKLGLNHGIEVTPFIDVGNYVLFGRGQGEKTIGVVIKINQKSIKVKSLEARGQNKIHPAGTVYRVSPEFIELASEGSLEPYRKEIKHEKEVQAKKEAAAEKKKKPAKKKEPKKKKKAAKKGVNKPDVNSFRFDIGGLF